MDESVGFAEVSTGRTWSRTSEICWVDDGSGVPWLAQIWQCIETGDLDYKPLETVKLPALSHEGK